MEAQESSKQSAFPCRLFGCSRSFKRKEHLNRHQANHESSPLYTCPACSRTFTRSDTLRRHMTLHQNYPKKNGRVSIACQTCRSRKIKCDTGDPCLTCSQLQVPCMRMGSSSQGAQETTPKLGYGIQTSNGKSKQIIETENYEEMRHDISQSYYECSTNAFSYQSLMPLNYPLELLSSALSFTPPSCMLDVDFDDRYLYGLLDTPGVDDILYDCFSGTTAQTGRQHDLGFI